MLAARRAVRYGMPTKNLATIRTLKSGRPFVHVAGSGMAPAWVAKLVERGRVSKLQTGGGAITVYRLTAAS
jgi:hypothetical protein